MLKSYLIVSEQKIGTSSTASDGSQQRAASQTFERHVELVLLMIRKMNFERLNLER